DAACQIQCASCREASRNSPGAAAETNGHFCAACTDPCEPECGLAPDRFRSSVVRFGEDSGSALRIASDQRDGVLPAFGAGAFSFADETGARAFAAGIGRLFWATVAAQNRARQQ